MSTSFLTRAQTASKLGIAISGTQTQFVTKAECVAAGANVSKLASYTDSQYPIDDDIVVGASVQRTITFNRLNSSLGYQFCSSSPNGISGNNVPLEVANLSGILTEKWTVGRGLPIFNPASNLFISAQPGATVYLPVLQPLGRMSRHSRYKTQTKRSNMFLCTIQF